MTVVTVDGVLIAVDDRQAAGEGPALFLAHATGFCGSCWRPVCSLLAPHTRRLVSWDFRGHGRSGSATIPLSWWEIARDVAAVRAATPVVRAVGVGHSMGGAALLMAQIGDPSRFDALVLVEPVVLPPPFRRADAHPLAQLARKRRTAFSDRDEARANFEGKGPFRGWHADALEGYLDSGLREAEGGGITLSCDPWLEAEVYGAAAAHGLAAMLGMVEVPVDVIAGSSSDTYPQGWAEELVARLPRGRLRRVEGAGHFLPMTHPDLLADAVVAACDALTPQR